MPYSSTMTLGSLYAVPCTALALLLAAQPLAGEGLRFSVEADDVISSAWKISTTTETVTSTLSLMGDDKDVGSDSESTRTLTFELVDEYGKVSEDGAPLFITRSFESLGSEFASGDSDRENESALEGEVVAFTFDAEAEEWSAAFGEDSDGEEDWLDNLSPRIDLVRVLPEEEPGVGDSWELSPVFLKDVLRPGGELMVQPSDDDEAEQEEGTIQLTLPGGDQFGAFEDYEGEITATLEEMIEEDDQRLARITVAVDVEVDLDITDDLEEQAEERGASESYSLATMSRTLEGSITVLWDIENQRPHSLNAELNGYTELQIEWTASAGELELEIGFVSEVNVTHAIEATFGD